MTEQIQRTVPAPLETTRDEDGRLSGLTLDYGLGAAADTANRWLVAVDGSRHGNHAVAEAIRLASNARECAVHVVNVQHWLSKEAAESSLMNLGLAATDAAWSLLQAAGVPWRLHIVMGEAADSIVALAERLGCHGIVVGTRGLGVAENLLIGSVAQRVIYSSHLPVLVVR
jgi:nucleotide-binding universal stress UspA family protein